MAFDLYCLLFSKLWIGTEKRRYSFLKSVSLLFLVMHLYFSDIVNIASLSSFQCCSVHILPQHQVGAQPVGAAADPDE